MVEVGEAAGERRLRDRGDDLIAEEPLLADDAARPEGARPARRCLMASSGVMAQPLQRGGAAATTRATSADADADEEREPEERAGVDVDRGRRSRSPWGAS